MNQRIRIVPPINGISEDMGEADQPQGTTPKAVNVRPIDPESGRMQIAQRAGYTDLLSNRLPGRVEAAATITYDDPKLVYRGPDSSTIEKVWSASISADEEALAVHVDRYGNLYVLQSSGSFLKFGPDGKEVARQAYFAAGIESVVPRIQTDFDGNVYIASSSKAGEASTLVKFEALEDDRFDIAWRWSGLWGIRDFVVFGGQAAVARFYAQSDIDDSENVVLLTQLYATSPTEAYETALPEPVSCIDVAESGEILFSSAANVNRSNPNEDGENWQTVTTTWSPHELQDVSGLEASWRLHWWIDAETLQGDYSNGAKIKRVHDRRWLHSDLSLENTKAFMVPPDPSYAYFAPTDDEADRSGYPGYHKGNQSIQTFEMPTYVAQGAGTKPSMRFNGPGPLYGTQDKFGISGANIDDWDWFQDPLGRSKDSWKVKNAVGNGLFFGQYFFNRGKKTEVNLASPADDGPDKDGKMPYCRQPIPGEDNMSWAMFMVVRLYPSERREVVWHHKSTNGWEIALLHNVDSASLDASCDLSDTTGVGIGKFHIPATPGKLTLFIGRGARVYSYTGVGTNTEGYQWQTHHSGGATHTKVISADTAQDAADTDSWSADAAHYVGNDKNIAIVGITINRESTPGSAVNTCEFRVNGRVMDTFHIDEDLATGLRAQCDKTESVFGMSTDRGWVTSFSNFYAWRGDLCEAITINGQTTDESEPNKEPFGYLASGTNARDVDAASALQWSDVSGQNYGTDNIAYTNAATEIERMEGYLAYKWGCQDVLPATSTGAVTTGGGFQNCHPFARHQVPGGGGGIQDVPPVGRAAAGGVLPTTTSQALVSTDEILGKVGTDGRVRWAISGGGHGLGVVAGVDGYLCAVGRHASGSEVVAKKVRDLGSSVRTTGDNVWEYEASVEPAPDAETGLAMDQQNILYWPIGAPPEFVDIVLTANLTNAPDILGMASNAATFGYVATTGTPGVIGGGSGVEFKIGSDEFETANNCAAAVNASGKNSGTDAQHAATVASEFFTASVYTKNDGGTSRPVLRLQRKQYTTRLYLTLTDATRWNLDAYPTTASYSITGAGVYESLQMPPAPTKWVAIGEDGEALYENTPAQGTPVCIAVDNQYPLMVLNPDRQGTAEHLYVGLDSPNEGQDTVAKYQQLKRTFRVTDTPGPRRTAHVAVAEGGLYVTQRGKAPTYAPGGAQRFNASSPFTKLWVYRQKLYGLDGLNYVVYDPRQETVDEWKAEGRGQIPKGAKLACVYGDRIVLARTDEDPHNLHMSARGDANDWDTAPDILTPLSAFSGNSTGNLHFRANDLVNCLIPARDDLLYIGGDRSFTRLTGDPGGQGQIDNISQLEGIAFGDSYAVGPSGEVYIKGINTGIWRIDAGGGVNLLTEGWIERRMQNIDLSLYDIRMAWSFRQKGLHVYVVPKVDGPRTVESFWWDAKSGGWWMDEWSDEDLAPTCATIWDSDEPGDRGVVIGCSDGMLRVEDEESANDGDKRIESEVILGPLTPADAEQVLFTALEPVLVGKPGYGGVWLEVYTAAIPDFQGGENAIFRHYVGPGYQGDLVISALANQIWVRLTNGAIGEKWALQTLFGRARVAGARRM